MLKACILDMSPEVLHSQILQKNWSLILFIICSILREKFKFCYILYEQTVRACQQWRKTNRKKVERKAESPLRKGFERKI